MTNPPGIPWAQYAQTANGTATGYTDWRPYTVSKVLLGLKKRGFGHGMYNGFGGKVDPGESVQAAGMRELEEEANITAPLEPCGLLFFVGAGHEHAHHITVFSATSWQGDPAESDEMRPEWFAYPETTGDSPDTSASRKPDSDVPAHHTTQLGTSLNDLASNLASNPTSASNHNPTATSTPASNPNPTSAPNLTSTSANPISDLAPFPYARMWKDDPLWIPHLLSNTPFVARVDYGPVPIPSPTDEPKLLVQGAGYELNGETIESGMQRWWVATLSWDEWRARRVWEV